jgi:hypothetical protein
LFTDLVLMSAHGCAVRMCVDRGGDNRQKMELQNRARVRTGRWNNRRFDRRNGWATSLEMLQSSISGNIENAGLAGPGFAAGSITDFCRVYSAVLAALAAGVGSGLLRFRDHRQNARRRRKPGALSGCFDSTLSLALFLAARFAAQTCANPCWIVSDSNARSSFDSFI